MGGTIRIEGGRDSSFQCDIVGKLTRTEALKRRDLTMVSPMRTILFANVGADMYGADYVLLCLVRSLSPEKFQSIVIVPYSGPLVSELEKAGATVIVREFPVLRRSVFTPIGILRFGWQMSTGLVFVLRLVRSRRVDILHTNTASLWVPGIAARCLKKPHIWQVMELVERPRIVALAMAKMTGLFSNKVFCISDAVRDHFRKDNPRRLQKFQTLYHGVDTSEYDPAKARGQIVRASLGIPDEAIVVLYAGRFSAWKGQDIFATAIPLVLAKTKKDVRFVMLGTCFPGQEEFELQLRETIRALNLPPDRVYLKGFQNNLPDWMNASNFFVLPSKNPEPNATVLIGAMAMGLPCIGTRIGGTVESIIDGETGIQISPSSSQDLAEAELQLIENPELRLRMGRAGRERALATFSMTHYCDTVQNAYDRL